jgi:hypothetical protein
MRDVQAGLEQKHAGNACCPGGTGTKAGQMMRAVQTGLEQQQTGNACCPDGTGTTYSRQVMRAVQAGLKQQQKAGQDREELDRQDRTGQVMRAVQVGLEQQQTGNACRPACPGGAGATADRTGQDRFGWGIAWSLGRLPRCCGSSCEVVSGPQRLRWVSPQ